MIERTCPCCGEVVRAAKVQTGPRAHRILCGDSTRVDDVQRLMDGRRAVMCATDPPYLVDYTGEDRPQSKERKEKAVAAGKRVEEVGNKKWDAYKDPETSVEFFAAFLRVALAHALVDNPAIYQWHASPRQALVEQAWVDNGLLVHQQLVWVKSRPILTHSHFMWQHEPCFYGWVEGKPPARRPPCAGENSTVWQIDQQSDGLHPTQKPREIYTRPIGYHTAPGDLCFEPFSGSGTHLVAAEQTGRICYAVEIAPEFVAVALERLAEMGLEPRLVVERAAPPVAA